MSENEEGRSWLGSFNDVEWRDLEAVVLTVFFMPIAFRVGPETTFEVPWVGCVLGGGVLGWLWSRVVRFDAPRVLPATLILAMDIILATVLWSGRYKVPIILISLAVTTIASLLMFLVGSKHRRSKTNNPDAI